MPLEPVMTLIIAEVIKKQGVDGILEKVYPKDVLDNIPSPIPNPFK